MNSLRYKDLNDMIQNLVVKEKTNYFICKCPACNSDEAYIYKKNMNMIKCSRENNCGEIFSIKYDDDTNTYSFKESKEVTEEEIRKSKSITKTIDNNVKKRYPLDFVYRGLEIDILKRSGVLICAKESKYEVDFKNEQISIKENMQTSNNRYVAKYDMIFPIRNDDNEITRLVYRSLDDNQFVKEYCKPIVQNSSDVLKLDMDSDIIIVSESILDGLSIKQSYDAGLYACRGITKVNGLKYEIGNNLDYWQNKTILISLDNDSAGAKYSTELSEFCTKHNIEYVNVEVPQMHKDWNEVLTSNDKDYVSSVIDNQVRDKLTEYLNDNNALQLKNLSEKHLNVSLKNKFLQEYYLNVFSSQQHVGPLNSIVLDLQYENSFFADKNIVETIMMNNNNSNYNSFDCKVIRAEHQSFFEIDGIKKELSRASLDEQKLIKDNLLTVTSIYDTSLVNTRVALSKEMLIKEIDFEKANFLTKGILEKYGYSFEISNNSEYDISMNDKLVSVKDSISQEDLFKSLSKLVIQQDKNITDELTDSAHKFFMSNFKLDTISHCNAIKECKDVRAIMKNNHALMFLYENNHCISYSVKDIIKKGLDVEQKGGDIQLLHFNQ